MDYQNGKLIIDLLDEETGHIAIRTLRDHWQPNQALPGTPDDALRPLYNRF
jgi:hypothetical protein